MSETATETPVQTETVPANPAQPVQESRRGATPRPPGNREVDGRFAKERETYQTSMREMQEEIRRGAQEMVRGGLGKSGSERVALPKETDKAALDKVAPAGKDSGAKTDSDKGTPTGTTSQAKPESSSKDATRPGSKELEKARKALELDGWSEEDFADTPESVILRRGKAAQETHAKVAREKREAAEAAKKAATVDPGKKASATASEDTDPDAEDDFDRLAEEHFKGFEAVEGDDPKAFQKAQARYSRSVVEAAKASLKAEFEDSIKSLESGMRGQMALDRAISRVARDIPQVDETDVRQKLVNRIAALASDPDTAEAMKTDLLGVIRKECAALGLKDETADREKEAREELRAAKAAGQPITTHHQSPPREPSDMEIARQGVREMLMKRR